MQARDKSKLRTSSVMANGEDFSPQTISSLQGMRFASCLRKKLREFYGGHIPSTAVIARDYSFRAGQLPPVSPETIRKWISGVSLPHMSRLSVLSDWLGADLLDAINGYQNQQKNINKLNSGNHHVTENSESSNYEYQLQYQLRQLSLSDLRLVISFIDLLIAHKQRSHKL